MTDDDYIMPFGKHQGKYIEDVPASYLLFISEQDWIVKYPEVEEYIQDKWEELKAEAKDEGLTGFWGR